MKTNKEWALHYLSLGFCVIPIGAKKPKYKSPYLLEWAEFEERLPTIEEVDKWWTKWPKAKIGIVCGEVSNLIVVDVDDLDKFNKSGVKLPITPTVKTGKGFHYYFKHDGVTTSTPKIGFGEIRSDGNYVIAPPSQHHSDEGVEDRQYEWTASIEDTQMQNFDLGMFGAIKEEMKARKSPLELLKGVKAGEGRNIAAASMAGFIFKLYPKNEWGTKGWEAMKAWNLSNETGGGWDEGELLRTYQSVNKTKINSEKKETSSKYKPVELGKLMVETPDPEPFIIDNLIKKHSLNIIHGGTGCGKSLLLLKMLDSITIGESFLGEFDVVKAKCLLIDLEMTRDDCIVRARDIVTPGNDSFIICEKPWRVTDEPSLQWLKEFIVDNNIEVVALDTLSKIHDKNEDSNSEMTPVMTKLIEICFEFKVTIIVLHHINKNPDAKGLAQSRGASAIPDNAGWQLAVSSIRVQGPYGDSVLAMTVSNEKLRLVGTKGKFKISITNKAEEERTYFEFLGAVDEEMTEVNRAREEVLKIIKENNGIIKKDLHKKIKDKKAGISSRAVDMAIDSLEGQKKIHVDLSQLPKKPLRYGSDPRILTPQMSMSHEEMTKETEEFFNNK